MNAMRYLAALVVALVALVPSVAAAQPPLATADQSFAWTYLDSDVALGAVVRFELRLDAEAFADVMMVPYTENGATEEYQAPIPATTTGNHTVEVRACNTSICGASTSFAFTLGVVPAIVPSVRIVETPVP